MNPIDVEDTIKGALRLEIEGVAAELRGPLTVVLTALAGNPPRPTQVVRVTGLDKSLASRFVRAVLSDSDLDLMHIVPSPEGLRILADLAASHIDSVRIAALRSATDRFQSLLDSTPGGRAAIDAQIAEGSLAVRERSEQSARQAAFKSMSFLLGQFCETLATSLFLVPSNDGRMVDGIEIHRRIGLRRIRPSTPMALLSMYFTAEEGRRGETVQFEPIDGAGESRPHPLSCLLPEFSSSPLPEFQIMQEGPISTVVLEGDPAVQAPSRLSSAFRVRNGWPVRSPERVQSMRGYVLHLPSRTVVRDLFVAESLYPGATPRVSFVLPGPRGSTPKPEDGASRHYANIDLTASIEQLPLGTSAYTVPGVADQPSAIRHVLRRAGHEHTRFRGWRCSIRYPVPMVEMLWWLVHPDLGQ